MPDPISYLIAPRAELDFFDVRSTETGRPVTVLEGWNLIRSEPSPLLGLAMRLRDVLSAPFGVQPISGRATRRRDSVRAGDKLDFFLVEHADDTDLVLTVRDSHLDVMIWLSARGSTYTVTSSVKTHNIVGRIYMLPVAPAHKLIVASDLKRLRRLTAASSGFSGRQI